MVTGTESSSSMEDFLAAWDIASSEYLPAFVVVSALFALTGAGVRPVGIERLADTVNRPVGETRALVDSLGGLARVDGESVHLTLGATTQSPRFRVRIEDRAIKAGGCAPDLFWIAVCSGKRVQVEAICRASAAPIRVELRPDGTASADPPGTVVAVVHPGRQPELMDTIRDTMDGTAGPDEDFCYHQPFFASPEAAAGWLATHPGGRLFTVAEFVTFWRRVTEGALAAAGVDIGVIDERTRG